MSEEQLLVTLGVKDANCTTKVKELNKEIKSLDSVYKKTSGTSKDFEKSTEGLKTKLEYLSKKYDANKAKLSAYREQMSKAKDMVAKKKEELERLKNSEEKNATAIQKAEKQLEKYQTQMNNANRNINETEAELKQLDTQINNTNQSMKNGNAEQYGRELQTAGEHCGTLGTKVSNVGDKISSLGQTVTVASAAVVALGKKAIDAFNEVDDGADDMIRATGATGENAEKLTEIYDKLNRESQASFKDVGNALGEVNTRFGFVGDEAEKCTLSFLHFSDITGTEAKTAVQLVSRAMGDAGIKSSEYAGVLDNLALAAQASGISVDKLTENLTKYGAPMRALGFDTKESIALFSSWEKAGVNTEIAFSGMKKAISNWGSAGKDSRKEFAKTLEEIKKCPNIAEATAKSIEVFGAKAGPDLADAIQGGRFAYEDFIKLLEGSAGTVENTYKEVNSEAEEANKIAVKEAKMSLAELGETLLTEVTPIVKDATEVIKKISNWFSNLDDNTKKNIMRFAELTAVAGPLLMVFGKLTKGIGGAINLSGRLITKIKGLSGASKVAEGAMSGVGKGVGAAEGEMATAVSTGAKLKGALSLLGEGTVATGGAWLALGTAVKGATTINDLHNKSILESTDNMSAFEKAMNWVDGSFHKSKEELEDMGLVYKDFNENVSPDFREQVTNSATDVRNLALEIDKVNLDGVVTDEERQSLVKRIDSMCQEGIATIQGYTKEGKASLEKLFLADDGKIDDNEKKVLDQYGKVANDYKKSVEEKENEMWELIQNGESINGEKVCKIMQDIEEEKLKILAKNNDEQKAIQSNFREQVSSMTLEGMSNEIKTEKDALDKRNEEIKGKYAEGIETLKDRIRKTSGVEREGLEKQLKEKETAYEKELKQSRKYYDDFVDVAIDGNEEARKHINAITGDLMTESEERSQNQLFKAKEMYSGLDKITKTGCYQLYNEQTGTMEKVAVVIDEKTGKIAGVWESSQNTVGECIDGMGKDAQELASKTSDTAYTVEEANKLMQDCTVNAAGQIVDKNGNIITSLQNVKTNADGTRDAIINLNGNTINVKINADGTIQKLSDIQYKMQWINSAKIGVNIATSGLDSALNKLDRAKKGYYGPGYATGTTNATKGVHLVGEEGPELVYFKGGETVIDANKTKNIITGGGYLNPGTVESTNLLNTTNTYNTNNYSNNNIDIKALGNIIASAVSNAITNLSINMDSSKVAEIIDHKNGKNIAWEGRLNGC